MFVSNCISEGHAVFVAVDGAVLQPDLVHAVSGGGGLCLMRLLCLDLCFNIKILRVSPADVTEGYTYGNSSGCRQDPFPGVCGRFSAACRSGVRCCHDVFLGRPRCVGGFGSKNKGCPKPTGGSCVVDRSLVEYQIPRSPAQFQEWIGLFRLRPGPVIRGSTRS